MPLTLETSGLNVSGYRGVATIAADCGRGSSEEATVG